MTDLWDYKIPLSTDCRSLVWDVFMLSSRCRTTLFWDSAGLLLLNTKDLIKILENREYFIRISMLLGIHPFERSYGDASFAECAKLFITVCRNFLLSVFGSRKSNSEFFSTMGLLLWDHYLFFDHLMSCPSMKTSSSSHWVYIRACTYMTSMQDCVCCVQTCL